MKACNWIFAAAVSLSLVAGSALAQPATDRGMAKRIELARRYYAAIHIGDLVDSTLKSLLPVMMQQEAQRFPGVTDAQRAIISETTMEAMHDFTPKLVERMLPSVATVFNEEELTQMVAFYESPVGQSAVTKTPALAAKMGPLLQEMMPDVQQDLIKRLCAKMSCPAGPAAPQRRQPAA